MGAPEGRGEPRGAPREVGPSGGTGTSPEGSRPRLTRRSPRLGCAGDAQGHAGGRGSAGRAVRAPEGARRCPRGREEAHRAGSALQRKASRPRLTRWGPRRGCAAGDWRRCPIRCLPGRAVARLRDHPTAGTPRSRGAAPGGGARTTTGACGPIDDLADRGGIRGGRGAPLSPSRAPVVAWRGREELGRVCRPAREEQRRRSRGAGAGVGVGVSSRSDAPCTRRGERMVGRSRWKAWSGTCSCGTGPERQGRPAYRIDADLRGWARTVVRFRSWVTRRARAKGTDLLAA